jgi:hypothetical protein
MKIYSSKYKHIVVSGCSFTHNNHDTPCSWPNILASWAGTTIDNLALPAAGNTHIKNSTILHLEQTRPCVDDTIVLIMWSGPEKIDWITDKNLSNFKNSYPFNYTYIQNNESVLGRNWWLNKKNCHVDDTINEYSKYQSNSSLSLNSWIQIQDLENYLKIKGYQYYFMSWFNYNDPVDNVNRWIDFDLELQKMNLLLDKNNWLANNNIQDSLGRWAQNHPEFLIDKIHMDWPGHESWLKEVLIPELIDKNILIVDNDHS